MFQVQCTCKDEPVKLLKDLLGRPSAIRLLVSLAAPEQGGSERLKGVLKQIIVNQNITRMISELRKLISCFYQRGFELKISTNSCAREK